MAGASTGDLELLGALRAGDEAAFGRLVDGLAPLLRRLARQHVATDAIAAEVVQDTWVAVIEGLDRFEGRSSLRTWIVRILLNQARTRGVREHRSVPFSSVGPALDGAADLGGFDPDRFDARGPHARGWSRPPVDWSTLPEERAEAAETRALLRGAIDALPERQRTVLTLRDVEGWSAAEVADALELSEVNQRVLLHRARGAVRRQLAEHLERVP